jgi:hypothetical protein
VYIRLFTQSQMLLKVLCVTIRPLTIEILNKNFYSNKFQTEIVLQLAEILQLFNFHTPVSR